MKFRLLPKNSDFHHFMVHLMILSIETESFKTYFNSEPEDKEKAGDTADVPEKAGEVENENADEAEDENNDCDCADSGTERILDRTTKLFVAFIIFLGGQHSS